MNADPATAIEISDHRACAVALFNYTWTLLEKTGRTDRKSVV